jgi:hypothetical protein
MFSCQRLVTIAIDMMMKEEREEGTKETEGGRKERGEGKEGRVEREKERERERITTMKRRARNERDVGV